MAELPGEIVKVLYADSVSATPSIVITGSFSIGGFGITAGAVDTTVQGAGAKTKRGSKKFELSPLTISVYLDPADTTHDFLIAAAQSGASKMFALAYDGSTPAVTFQGVVTKAEWSEVTSEGDNNQVVEFEITPTGANLTIAA